MIEYRRRTRGRRGVIVPVVVVAVAIFLSALALVVDGGLMFLGAGGLRTLADVTALAAASAGDEASARRAAARMLAVNGSAGCTADVTVTPSADGSRVVSVVLRGTVPLFVSRGRGGSRRVMGVTCSARALARGGHVRLVP